MYESGNDFGAAVPMMFGAIGWFIILAVYVYFSFAMFKIAQRTGHEDKAWWAWIPIFNTFLLLKMAGKPNWWFFLLLVPIVNIVCFFILWMETAKACGKPAYWGVLAMLPFIQVVAIGVLAFSSSSGPAPSFPSQPRQPQKVE